MQAYMTIYEKGTERIGFVKNSLSAKPFKSPVQVSDPPYTPNGVQISNPP